MPSVWDETAEGKTEGHAEKRKEELKLGHNRSSQVLDASGLK